MLVCITSRGKRKRAKKPRPAGPSPRIGFLVPKYFLKEGLRHPSPPRTSLSALRRHCRKRVTTRFYVPLVWLIMSPSASGASCRAALWGRVCSGATWRCPSKRTAKSTAFSHIGSATAVRHRPDAGCRPGWAGGPNKNPASSSVAGRDGFWLCFDNIWNGACRRATATSLTEGARPARGRGRGRGRGAVS